MYNDQLQEKLIEVDKLFLDPNNPRFWAEEEIRSIEEKRIPDQKVQEITQDLIEQYGVEELYYSILRNGFLPLDRIVVRSIQGHASKYVVVEGNRRLAAIKLLRYNIDNELVDEEGISEDYLEELRSSIDEIKVLVYTGADIDNISWIFQGIRHISGIYDWKPAQRARLVTEQYESKNMNFTQAGHKFGLSGRAVGRYYRGYKGLQQMKEDDEFGGKKAKNEYFSLFEAAWKNRKVRNWLGWSDKEKRFTNEDNLKLFYSWITPDEENNNRRRIHDPHHISYLALLLEKEREDLIGQIDRHELTIDGAKERAEESTGSYDWSKEIEKAKQIIDGIPHKVYRTQGSELQTALKEMQDIVESALKSCE